MEAHHKRERLDPVGERKRGQRQGGDSRSTTLLPGGNLVSSRARALACGALALLVLPSCSRLSYDATNTGESVLLRQAALPADYELFERPARPGAATPLLHIESSARWIVWGIPWNHPNWEDQLREQQVACGGLANLRYTVEHRWDDWVVGILTLGFYRTATVTLEARCVDLVPRTPLPPGTEPPLPPAPTTLPQQSLVPASAAIPATAPPPPTPTPASPSPSRQP